MMFLVPAMDNLGIGGVGYNPADISSILQIFNPFSYAPSNLANIPVLSSSVGTLAVPRGQRCALFDGNNDYAMRGGRVTSGTVTQLSGCVWIKFTTTNDFSIMGERGGVGQYSWMLWANVGKLWFETSANGASLVNAVTAGTINNGEWRHVAFTYNAGVLKLYVDGQLESTTTLSATLFNTNASFVIGTYPGGGVLSGRVYDARVYNVAKSAAEVEAIHNQHLTPSTIDRTGALAIWPLQEESGTTHYDISGNGRNLTATNITQATYHATDAGVKYSFPNELGYTLSGSVIIPASLTTPTQDAAGGSLQYAGPIALSSVMEVPCVTGGSSLYIDAGSALIPATADFTVRAWYWHVSSGSNIHCVMDQRGSGGTQFTLLANYAEPAVSANKLILVGGGGFVNSSVDLIPNAWNYIEVTRNGSNWSLQLNGSAAGSFTGSSAIAQTQDLIVLALLSGGFYGSYSPGRIAGLSITTGGVTKYPLFDQCGPGSSNTNRDFYIMGSDGSATLVIGGIVNGTISAIYANRCPFVRDWCIENGGGIAANGAFIPGRIGSSLDAAGNAKTLPAGEHRNPFSRFIPNNWSAPSLVNIGSTSSDKYAPDDISDVQTESVADTRFGSNRAYLAFREAQTGEDLTDAEDYVS